MPEPKGPSDFVDAAYHIEDETEMVEFYKKWAEDYDREMLQGLGYESPTKIAQLLNTRLAQKDAEIFDVGCGTGLTCVFLAAQGYENLDGIDISPEMVRVAGERGIYRELIVGDVNQALERDDAVYDGVISSGTFTHGHVGPQPLDEIFRVLKAGGYLACTVHEDLWESMGFRAKFEQLTADGVADEIDLHKDSYYRDGPPEGYFCVYQKAI